MMNLLQNFFNNKQDQIINVDQTRKDLILAQAVVLIYVVAADSTIDAQEWLEIEKILSDTYNLPREKVEIIQKNALESFENANDIHQFCYRIKQDLSREERIAFVEELFMASISDGEISFAEHKAVWKVCHLLGIETQERVKIKHKILGKE